MSKGVQIAGGATLIALILGWYAATNLDGGIVVHLLRDARRVPGFGGGLRSGAAGARARLRGAADRSSATWRPRQVRFRVQNEPAPRGRRLGRAAARRRLPRASRPRTSSRTGPRSCVEGRLCERRAGRRLPRRQGLREVPLEVRGQGPRATAPSEPGMSRHVRARRLRPPLRPARSPCWASVAGVYAGSARRADWTRVAERALWIGLRASSAWRCARSFAAFASFDFQLRYVAAHSARDMALPTGWRRCGAARPARCCSGCGCSRPTACACVWTQRHQNRALMPWVSAVLLANAMLLPGARQLHLRPLREAPAGRRSSPTAAGSTPCCSTR